MIITVRTQDISGQIFQLIGEFDVCGQFGRFTWGLCLRCCRQDAGCCGGMTAECLTCTKEKICFDSAHSEANTNSLNNLTRTAKQPKQFVCAIRFGIEWVTTFLFFCKIIICSWILIVFADLPRIKLLPLHWLDNLQRGRFHSRVFILYYIFHLPPKYFDVLTERETVYSRTGITGFAMNEKC